MTLLAQFLEAAPKHSTSMQCANTVVMQTATGLLADLRVGEAESAPGLALSY